MLTEANVLYSTKDYAGAISVLKQALEISPHDQDLQELQVKVQEAYQLEQDTLNKQQKRTERVLKRIQSSKAKAEEYEAKGQHYRALKEYEFILSMNAKGPEIEAIKGKASEQRKILEEQTRSDLEAGQQLAEQEKYEEAMLEWRKVLEVYPDHPGALSAMQQLLPTLEKKAKELYQQGLVYEDLGQTAKAVESYEQAMEVLEINPKHEYYLKSKKKLKEHGAL